MPLNAGVLAPIDIRIPYNTLLNPSEGVAVSSGNTEASQRTTDVIFKAFEATAASQGCEFGVVAITCTDVRYECYHVRPAKSFGPWLRRDR